MLRAMSNLIPRLFIFSFAFLILAFAVQNASAQQPEFCWKDTTTRGAGTVPSACPSGAEKVNGICYDKCPSGFKRASGGLNCLSVCPSGMRNDGLYCRIKKESYGRGVGWTDRKKCEKKFDRCEQDRKKGSWYAKCRDGYRKDGLICYANKPNCKALGMGARVADYSCKKKEKKYKTRVAGCSGKEKDAGLCYKKCPANFKGVGPVCWAQNPKGWVNCGMGTAKNSATCAQIVFGQVSSVGMLALNISTAGGSGAATKAASSADDTSKLAKLKKKFEELKEAYEAAKKASPALQNAEKAYNTGKTAYDNAQPFLKGYTAYNTGKSAVTEEDLIRMSAQIAAIVDTSGVADVVASYTYPKCSKYFGK
jgi:hypothetical protein